LSCLELLTTSEIRVLGLPSLLWQDTPTPSERSVKRDIQELVQLGELKVELQNAPTRQQYKTNLYWITINSGVTESTAGVTDWVSRGDSSGKSGVTPVGTQNIIRTIKEPLLKSDLDSFETFWLLYPKKGSQS
jgi:hypothetical protein